MVRKTNESRVRLALRRIVENGKRAGERKFKRDCMPSVWIRSWYANPKRRG